MSLKNGGGVEVSVQINVSVDICYVGIVGHLLVGSRAHKGDLVASTGQFSG